MVNLFNSIFINSTVQECAATYKITNFRVRVIVTVAAVLEISYTDGLHPATDIIHFLTDDYDLEALAHKIYHQLI